jgi:hypothetical protein
MSKIAVYFMPGLAASATILKESTSQEHLRCIFRMEVHLVMNLYRINELLRKITHENCFDWSFFGGILVQEMANFMILEQNNISV